MSNYSSQRTCPTNMAAKDFNSHHTHSNSYSYWLQAPGLNHTAAVYKDSHLTLCKVYVLCSQSSLFQAYCWGIVSLVFDLVSSALILLVPALVHVVCWLPDICLDFDSASALHMGLFCNFQWISLYLLQCHIQTFPIIRDLPFTSLCRNFAPLFLVKLL